MARSPEAFGRAAGGRRGKPRRAAGLAVASILALLVSGGAGMIAAAFTVASVRPPQPAAQLAPNDQAAQLAPDDHAIVPTPSRDRTTSPTPPAVALPRSVPTRLTIPRIGVDTDLLQLGADADGSIQVPDVKKQPRQAGWYKLGASPGEIGNAVIVGHVNTRDIGPAVFYKLGALKKGDKITINRADGKRVTFVVGAVTSYPKTKFPTDLVYAAGNQAGLRLVTCGGEFDRKQRTYKNNIIVFATAVPTP